MVDCLKLKGMENNPLHCYAVTHSLIKYTETLSIDIEVTLKRLFYYFVKPDLHDFSFPVPKRMSGLKHNFSSEESRKMICSLGFPSRY